MTESPPFQTHSDNATADRIHDAYIEDFKTNELVKYKFKIFKI